MCVLARAECALELTCIWTCGPGCVLSGLVCCSVSSMVDGRLGHEVSSTDSLHRAESSGNSCRKIQYSGRSMPLMLDRRGRNKAGAWSYSGPALWPSPAQEPGPPGEGRVHGGCPGRPVVKLPGGRRCPLQIEPGCTAAGAGLTRNCSVSSPMTGVAMPIGRRPVQGVRPGGAVTLTAAKPNPGTVLLESAPSQVLGALDVRVFVCLGGNLQSNVSFSTASPATIRPSRRSLPSFPTCSY
jgi:hypothetical protein